MRVSPSGIGYHDPEVLFVMGPAKDSNLLNDARSKTRFQISPPDLV
jgi:hypothetical protein